MDNVDKEVLEAELEARVTEEELKGSKVVFRNGSRMVTSGLNMVAAKTAKTIVILSEAGNLSSPPVSLSAQLCIVRCIESCEQSSHLAVLPSGMPPERADENTMQVRERLGVRFSAFCLLLA